MSIESDLRVILEGLSGEITLGEERLKSKLDTTEYLKDTIKTTTITNKKIEELHIRINGLYLKIAGATGILVGLLELAFRMTKD